MDKIKPDRARLEGPLPNGQFKWCVYPCQKVDEDGQRIDRECRVPTDPRYIGGAWSASGAPDAPTLTPSVNCENCWHGFIVDGEVRP